MALSHFTLQSRAMVLRWWVAVCAACLLSGDNTQVPSWVWTCTAGGEAEAANVSLDLHFYDHSLDPLLICNDGSPGGFYYR